MSIFFEDIKPDYEGNLPFVRVRYEGEYDLAKTLDCGQSCCAHCGNGFVTAGKIPKIEHASLYWLANVVFNVVVRVVDKGIVFGATCRRKIFAS